MTDFRRLQKVTSLSSGASRGEVSCLCQQSLSLWPRPVLLGRISPPLLSATGIHISLIHLAYEADATDYLSLTSQDGASLGEAFIADTMTFEAVREIEPCVIKDDCICSV
jgi:hypothetical protein